ncbi:MAG TPA: hypothetical protein VGR31_16125 [Planctomycetota bacterium]|jgi:V8-like Glu-specific endopeptidase|nr:hypothetical protein [Planctomycetota bacterium]
MMLRNRLLALSLPVSLAAVAAAQDTPPSLEIARTYDTGLVRNTGERARTIASFPVRAEGAPWIRLAFSEIELPERGATLVITSVLDGARQELRAEHCRQWRNTSAYFNGDDVQVEILADPSSGPCRVVLSSITAGVNPPSRLTQCGTTDDRVLSSDPRQGRALPIGCTAWLIDDCSHNFLTAGHCSGASLQTIEFNVPLSTASGAIQHPPPQDQYSVDVGSKQSTNGGIGNDWGYFGVFPNASTGLRPYQKQHATYVLAPAAPAFDASIVIRITGYGVDSSPPQNNQVQQTSTGPYALHSGTHVAYRTDTEGGNSGSPVLWDQQNLAIGIHTHGGCSASGGSNSGTASEHAGLRAALANPLGQCACRGEASTYCTGKINSQGCLEAIGSSGTPSATAGPGSFHVTGTQILNNRLGVLFYAHALASTPFQGGTMCLAAPLSRTPAQLSGGNPGAPDCSGTFDFDMGARIASGADASLVVGANVFAQYFSRDAASPSGPYGLTNGLQFTVGP